MNRRTAGLSFVVLCLLAGRGAILSQTQPSQTQKQDETTAMATVLDKEFTSEAATVNGITLHYVRGGTGPALVLIHGFPQDWFEYRAIMPRLAKRFTIVAVDLRGIGGSTATPAGYDAANMAEDIRRLLSTLKLGSVFIVGHDIGGHVAYAFVRRYPTITRGAMILDTPIPGVQGWDEIQGAPYMWHMTSCRPRGSPRNWLTAGRPIFSATFSALEDFRGTK
jgi:pimeloyl-ACP methyl ester carboxylesterase